MKKFIIRIMLFPVGFLVYVFSVLGIGIENTGWLFITISAKMQNVLDVWMDFIERFR